MVCFINFYCFGFCYFIFYFFRLIVIAYSANPVLGNIEAQKKYHLSPLEAFGHAAHITYAPLASGKKYLFFFHFAYYCHCLSLAINSLDFGIFCSWRVNVVMVFRLVNNLFSKWTKR
jgi:hypothetical protein